METDNYIFFCSDKGELGIYSQWFPITFIEDYGHGVTIEYKNAEQYMMAHKAILFGDGDTLQQILDTDNPATIKNLGSKVAGFNQEVWDKNKFSIVKDGNKLKFKQNKDLKEKLLATGNKKLVEAAHYDKIWGIGLRAVDAVRIPENEWPGQNLLGKALMEVRQMLRSKN